MLKNIFLFSALLLFVLHSSIPHIHNNMEKENTQLNELNSFRFFYFLSHCFQHDLGEDHLEHFSKSDHQVPTFDYLLLTFDQVPSFIAFSKRKEAKLIQILSFNRLISGFTFSTVNSFLRAPPVKV